MNRDAETRNNLLGLITPGVILVNRTEKQSASETAKTYYLVGIRDLFIGTISALGLYGVARNIDTLAPIEITAGIILLSILFSIASADALTTMDATHKLIFK